MSPRRRKSCIERIYDQVKTLKDVPDYIKSSISTYDVSYAAHTILKLSFLNYYTGFFLPIAYNQIKRRGGKMIFIDALAGSGIVKVKGLNLTIRGSSLVAALAKKYDAHMNIWYGFNEIYSIEKDYERFNLLKERFEKIKDQNDTYADLYPIYGDANEKINEIADKVSSKDFILLFIDPEGITEVKLESFNKLFSSSRQIDVMLNYNYMGVLRTIGAGNEQTVKRFVPTQVSNKDPLDAVREYFNTLGKDRQIVIRVRSKGNSEIYKMLLAVRTTSGGSDFIERLKPLQTCINTEIDGEVVENAITTKGGLMNYLTISEKN